PVVPLSPLTRTLYAAPGVSPATTMDSLRPSGPATPLATSVVPVLSYRSIFGLSMLTNSPGPSLGVLVSNRRGFPVLGAVIEYQSPSGKVVKTSWTVPVAPLVPPNINCVAVPANVVIAPPSEIEDPIAAFRAARADA